MPLESKRLITCLTFWALSIALVESCDSAEINPEPSAALLSYKRGVRAQERGDLVAAAQLFERAFADDPSRLDYLLAMAKNYHELYKVTSKYFDEAQTAYRAYIEALDETSEHSMATRWLQCDRFDLGLLYLEAGAYQVAITSMVDAVEHCPDLLSDGEAVNALGMGHYYLGNYEAAAKYFYQAVEVEPSLYVASYNLWSVKSRLFLFSYLRNSTKAELEPKSALRQINQLRRIAPHFIEAVALEGKILLESGRLDEAYAHFANLVATGEKGPEIDSLRIEMIRILIAKGDTEAAKRQLLDVLVSLQDSDIRLRGMIANLLSHFFRDQEVATAIETTHAATTAEEREKLPFVSRGHQIFNCNDCHLDENSLEVLLSCGGCHPSFINIHPVDFIPKRELPEGFIFNPEGKMVCATCHLLHGTVEGSGSLRYVNSANHSRDEFCSQCHGADLSRQNPHKKGVGASRCVYCHSTQSDKSDSSGRAEEICNFCHGVMAKDHPKALYFFDDETSIVDVAEEEWTCITCHMPHGASGAVTYLRPEVASAIERVRRRDPHLAITTTCHNCHRSMDEESANSTQVGLLRYEGDVGMLCTSCHIKDAGHHPMGVVLPEGHLDFNMTQSDVGLNWQNRIDCYTCHLIDWKAEDYRVKLRVSEEGTIRNSLCWKCHNKKNFVRRSPHVENRRLCLHCHERPLTKQEAPFTLDVPELVCDVCHEVKPHPYGRHLGNPSHKVDVPAEFPLGKSGQILCYTCHDPHQLETQAEMEENPLRLREGVTDCSRRCHIRL